MLERMFIVHEINKQSIENKKTTTTIRQLDNARQRGCRKISELPATLLRRLLPISAPRRRQLQEWIHHTITFNLLGYGNH